MSHQQDTDDDEHSHADRRRGERRGSYGVEQKRLNANLILTIALAVVTYVGGMVGIYVAMSNRITAIETYRIEDRARIERMDRNIDALGAKMDRNNDALGVKIDSLIMRKP